MQAVIVPALPVVQRDLGTSTEWAAWTISIYLLSASVATPLLASTAIRRSTWCPRWL